MSKRGLSIRDQEFLKLWVTPHIPISCDVYFHPYDYPAITINITNEEHKLIVTNL